ncbi:MAG TPA: alpha/beta hydrolase [Vineibacter sp.]|nr:alpha/beta hydrolase [Vineibacter sp.]
MVDRRDVLMGGLVAGAMAGPALAAPQQGDRTYVLVHGAWHNALHWQPVATRLSALGHRVVAVDLPAHGLNARFPDAYIAGNGASLAAEVSPARGITLEDAAQAVVTMLRALGDRKSVLVGHSVGGAVITRTAELAPERIDRLVYLTAFAPIGLGSPAAYGALPEARTGYGETLFIGNPAEIGAVRINPRGDAAYLRQLREAYYNDVAYENFLPYAAMLTPDLPLSFWTTPVMVSPDRWGRVARTYIRCLNDRALAPAIQDRMIADADRVTPHNMFKVETMTTGHSPFASSPDVLAAILANL